MVSDEYLLCDYDDGASPAPTEVETEFVCIERADSEVNQVNQVPPKEEETPKEDFAAKMEQYERRIGRLERRFKHQQVIALLYIMGLAIITITVVGTVRSLKKASAPAVIIAKETCKGTPIDDHLNYMVDFVTEQAHLFKTQARMIMGRMGYN